MLQSPSRGLRYPPQAMPGAAGWEHSVLQIVQHSITKTQWDQKAPKVKGFRWESQKESVLSSLGTCKNLIYRKDMISNFSAYTGRTLLCKAYLLLSGPGRYTFWTDHTHCRAIKGFWFGEIKSWLCCANEQSLFEDGGIKVKGERSWSGVKTQRSVRKRHDCLPFRRRVFSPRGCQSIS